MLYLASSLASSMSHHSQRWTTRPSSLAFFIVIASFITTGAIAAENVQEATTRYQAEKALCNSGESNQDKATCLKEAGAALADSKNRRSSDSPVVYRENALQRCTTLPASERDACQRRIAGDGATSGSVATGGILREVATPDKK
jgi:hypothetical protein